ncbi:NAD(P)/FAD-dependent oxidoreductase [Nocardioides sp. LS1]|uniref:flavin-containing monooxygenase n=1 Tax=Nocardioides sp. LS1 TaxID=1027620 RepID=UPI000FFA380C|nr:NAD(P)/FAD-dependent oxidoreductase [Nocardioides sp. LS1]GCD89658.1 putative monooxygenase [Nocardioides sp. LS1]
MTHQAVIVGAGFGGMGAAIQLKRLGIDDFVVLEREDDLGGTWHVNRYPGLAVDIASVTYSYSFEPNPWWSHWYARGPELKQYAVHVADRYDLRRHMRFGQVVEGATWDEVAQEWEVRVAGAEPVRGRYLITATGFLSQPRMPDIEGVHDFAGTVLHTARWDDDADLDGKRVAIIGTGATAVQLIPELARRAAHLTVFQRTPIWVTPKMDREMPKAVQRLFARVPATQRAARKVNTSVLELVMVAAVLHYRQWNLLNRGAAAIARRHLARQVADPELRAKLTPDYSFGCKRPTFSNDYYPAFTEPHVDLETTSIRRITPTGIVTADGRETEVDVLVLATGFDMWDANFPAISVVGRDGKDLGAWWRATRFQAYQGIAVPGFPNFLSLASPYSYSGLSYFTTIEGQMKHMDRLLSEVARRGASSFEVRDPANEDFLGWVTERLEDSVFSLGQCATARSYYFNQHGEAALLRPSSTINTHREAASFPVDDYEYA